MRAVFQWLQETGIAMAAGQSLELTAALSSIHLLGLTLVVGGAIVSFLRLSGLLKQPSVSELTRVVTKATFIGLTISVISGVLLFAPRAVSASGNTIFQLKMAALAASVFFQLGVSRFSSRAEPARLVLALAGVLGFALWFGVAVAGSAYILLE